MPKVNSTAKLNALCVKDDLIEAVELAIEGGRDGLSFKEAVGITGLSYHHTYGAVYELCEMGALKIGTRSDRNQYFVTLPSWSAPTKLDLTPKQQGAFDYLVSIMDEDGLAYTSYKEISMCSTVPVGGIVAALDAIDKKGYISILLRGKGARRTVFRVYPDGDGPRDYSPFHHGMIEAPMHLGVPLPASFSEWAPNKTVADAIARYDRSAPVVRRWFAEVGITPARLVRKKKPAKPKKPREVADPVLVYPFLVRDRGTPEHVLMRKVNDLVPAWLPPDRRADICQDMIVAVLCGDIDEALLDLSVKDFTKQVMKMHPTMFGDLSLDAPIGDSDNFTIADTIAAETTRWDFA